MWQVMQPWYYSDEGDKFGMEEREPVDLKLRSFLDLLWQLNTKTTTVKSKNVLLIPLGR